MITGLRRANEPQCNDSCIDPALTRKGASVILITTTANPSCPTDDYYPRSQSLHRPPFQHYSCGPLGYKFQNTAP